MPEREIEPPFDQLLAAAESVARARPEVDPDLAREVFREAAILLDDGLALDGLDDHDAAAVIAGLCVDLVSSDPGAAIRARAAAIAGDAGDAHDPEGVWAAYLTAAQLMQL